MIKLTKRLQKIADFVHNNSVVADVGSDHGYLCTYLVSNNFVKKAYAIDNKQGPFLRLSKNVSNYKNIIPVLSNGIDDLYDDVDTLVLAGLGTPTILKILSNREKLRNIKTIITDSHNDLYSLRKFIVNLGFYIEKEEMILDMKKYYTIIRFERGNDNYSDFDLFFGPILLKNKSELFIKYWDERKDKLENIVNGLSDNENITKLKDELRLIRRMKDEN